MIRVTIWNEFKHDREYEGVHAIYPDGIHTCLARALGVDADLSVRTATFGESEHGLTQSVLDDTDVLVFWSHALQNEFSDGVVARVQQTVLSGMGLVALHSAHFSKVMKLLMGTSMTLKWKHGEHERLWCINPTHPIAQGVPECVELPEEEMYGEYFDMPKPDDVVFAGWFSGSQVFRSGCTFTRGLGRVFYFQPRHEEYPVYHNPQIQRIIVNAVHWCAPMLRRRTLECEAL